VGTAILDALLPGSAEPTGVETFLAAAIYLRTCAYERTRFRATLAS
jgi:hypothetical protein